MPRRKKLSGEELLKDIRQTLYIDIKEFRENQEEVISALLDGKDAFIIMPTGSGKSVCFQYPALKKKGITIVIEPIVALMEDQVNRLKKSGIKVKYIKRLPKSEQEINTLLNDGAKIYYISPENFLSPKFIFAARNVDISMLVIDEAHCISMWGNGFRPRYLKLGKAFSMIGKRPQTVAFTATAGDFIKKQVKLVLGMKDNIYENAPADPKTLYKRDNVQLIIKNIKTEKDKNTELINDILDTEENGAIIIYCNTPKSVETLFKTLNKNKKLKKANIAARFYHGKLDPIIRKTQQREFMKEKSRQIMVATTAFGMGIDKKNVRTVIYYEVPRSIEDYFQGIGRAGRDGKPAKSVVYSYYPDIMTMRLIVSGEDENVQDSLNGKYFVTMDENEQKEHNILTEIAENRFSKFEKYIRKSPEKLQDYIVDYFRNYRFENIPDKNEKFQFLNQRIKERIQEPEYLYMASCKLAYDIRDGKLKRGETYYDDKNNITAVISDNVDFFDLMLANAVYTLGFNGITSISVKKIFHILTGDSTAAPEPKVREMIYSRLCKLMNTDIEITLTERGIKRDIKGKFLILSRKTERIFTYESAPPVCSYAVTDGFKFISVNLKWLKVTEKKTDGTEKIIDDNINNILIKLYMAWRISMLTPPRFGSARIYNAEDVRFEHYDKRRTALFEMGNIQRTRDFEKIIDCILEYYRQLGIVSGYEYFTDKKDKLFKIKIAANTFDDIEFVI